MPFLERQVRFIDIAVVDEGWRQHAYYGEYKNLDETSEIESKQKILSFKLNTKDFFF